MRKKNFYQRVYRHWLIKQAARKRHLLENLNKKMERSIQVIAGLFFVGILLTGIFGTPTLLSWWQISRIFVVFALVFSFYPLRWLPKIFSIHRELKILLSICGVAPFLTGIVLMLNYSISTQTWVETYKITEYKSYYQEDLLVIKLENNQLKQHTELRRFPLNEQLTEPDSVAYTLKMGFFGMTVVTDKYIIGKK